MIAFILSILHFLLNFFIFYVKLGLLVTAFLGAFMIIALLCARDYWYQFQEEMMDSFRQIDAEFETPGGMWAFLLITCIFIWPVYVYQFFSDINGGGNE